MASDGIPLTQVKRGNLELEVHAGGELNAKHTMMLTAPAVGGGALQITRLLAGRLPVKGGRGYRVRSQRTALKLEQSRSELLQAKQEITKAKGDAAVLKAQEKWDREGPLRCEKSRTRCAEERDCECDRWSEK